jgi:tetratricopeptide (TPR) repeat protein
MMKSLAANKYILIGAIALITFICFNYTLQNQFTNWDDNYYITKNPNIKGINAHNLKNLFFTEGFEKSSNYHPFCLLSLAVNYSIAGLNPTTYYLTNILLHIANTILLFFLFLQLCRRIKMDNTMGLLVASIGSLWFGIHPMHVESVSWIAERKDVLYGFFYIIGLLTYLRYLDKPTAKWYAIMCLLLVCSCLSKGMAVVFPLSLLCIDFLLGREINKKLILEKIPFFAISLLFGILTFYFQKKSGAVSDFGVLTIAERVMYASYGFVMYIYKFFNPSYLSTFYPYPFRILDMDHPDQPGKLNGIFYAAPFIVIGLLTLPLYFAWKKDKGYFRVIGFGMGFLLVNLILVLQFLSVGAAIMADRYSYIAYIGLIFLIAYILQDIISKKPSFRIPIIVAILIFSGALGAMCHQRTSVWHDARSLLTDGVEKYPFKKDPDKQYDKFNSGIAILSYKWLGNYYFDKGEYDSALTAYQVLVTLRSSDEFVDGKIAHIKMLKSGADQVLQAAMQPAQQPVGDYKPYLDSSYYFSKKGDSLKAFRCYIMAFRFNPGVEKIYADNSFNCVQTKQFDDAISQYSILLKLNTSNPYYYFYRGVAKFSQNKVKDAVIDWEASLKVNAKEINVQQSAAYNLSVAYDTLGKDSLAYYYVQKAKGVGYKINDDFFAKLKKKWEMHKK